ncbi:hypothetical protein F5Y12DRAFT_159529 [Xylaria sp. FL1777]|nr:hypothetical protein F5Y12DRAFT_159529 [Xylaria sp. FL1777]
MKTSVLICAVSAGLVVAELLPPPDNFPACGTTCFGNMLSQASQLGCGGGGSTENAVDGACLCKNVDFSYGIIDCANAACPNGVAPTVIQYGINWCGEKGIFISGLSATPDPAIASSPTFTVSAVATTRGGNTESGTASATAATSSESASITTLSNGSSETSGIETPISTTEVVSTLTNSDGSVVTTTISTSLIYATSGTSYSPSESGSASESTLFTESTKTASGSTEITSSATGESTSTGGAPTTTGSDGGSRQTAAPVGLVAAAGLVALML